MMNYVATFTRYSAKRAERQVSGHWTFMAEDFADAVRTCNIFMRGMADRPDEDWKYDIASIECHAYSGTRFKGYLSIWEDAPSERKESK